MLKPFRPASVCDCVRSKEVRPPRHGATRCSSLVVAFLDEGDHAGERAPMVEFGARAVAAVVVGRLVRREVLTDMPVLPPL